MSFKLTPDRRASLNIPSASEVERDERERRIQQSARPMHSLPPCSSSPAHSSSRPLLSLQTKSKADPYKLKFAALRRIAREQTERENTLVAERRREKEEREQQEKSRTATAVIQHARVVEHLSKGSTLSPGPSSTKRKLSNIDEWSASSPLAGREAKRQRFTDPHCASTPKTKISCPPNQYVVPASVSKLSTRTISGPPTLLPATEPRRKQPSLLSARQRTPRHPTGSGNIPISNTPVRRATFLRRSVSAAPTATSVDTVATLQLSSTSTTSISPAHN